MHMDRIKEATVDLDKANLEISQPDQSHLIRFGMNESNLAFIQSQFKHYSYLMTPIIDFSFKLAEEVRANSNLERNV